MIDVLRNRISKCDVISFDIFDTIVYRPFVKPTDLFLQIEVDYGCCGFKDERIRAELFLRDTIINAKKCVEITLDQIYEEIDSSYRHFKEIEIQYEINYCKPNPEMLQLYTYALTLKKHIVITSDMYLPSHIIKSILQNVGIQEFEHLILSCENLTSKADKSSYRHLKTLYPTVTSQNILHIGDNHYTDYLNARSELIHAIHYEGIHERFLVKTIISKEILHSLTSSNDLEFSKYFGSLAIHYHEKAFEHEPIEKIAYEIVNPLVMSFNANLIQYCKKNQIRKIFFASRDGFIFKESFDRFFNDSSYETEKLYVSRRICTLPVMEFDSNTDFAMWAQGMENSSIMDLWNNLEINDIHLNNEFIQLANNKNTLSFSDIVTIYHDFFTIHGHAIKRHYKKESSVFFNYLDSIGYFNKDIIVVELGWSGSLQNAIHKLGSMFGKTQFPVWYYLGIRDDAHIRIKDAAEGFIFTQTLNDSLQETIRGACDYIELLFSAPTTGVKKIDFINSTHCPVLFAENNNELKRIHISQKIFDVIEDNWFFELHSDMHGFSKTTLRELLKDYIYNIPETSEKLFSDIKVSANFQNTNYSAMHATKFR